MPTGKRNPRQGGDIRFHPERHTDTTGLTITRGGAVYIAITLLLGFAAVNTGNNLLFLIVSALLGFMAVTGISGWQNIRGLRVAIELPDEIYSGLATQVKFRLENGKPLIPSFLLHSTLLGNTNTTHLLKSGEVDGCSFVHAFTGRGIHALPQPEIRSPFPVNFFVRRKRVVVTGEFTVFPAPLYGTGITPFGNSMKRSGSPSSFKGNYGEISRIADYTGNEPMKMIHWRLSAKHEELKVKEMGALSGEPVVIDIDSLQGSGVEEKLSLACHLINRLIADNRPVCLKLRDRIIGPGLSREHRLKLLGELAVYDKD